MGRSRFAALEAELGKGGSTALILRQSGNSVFAWGAVGQRSSLASVRKSLISALYGISVETGEVDLDMTLAEIGIDDNSPLTAVEEQATIRDLLSARSGIYHPCVYDTERGRPERGSHLPGTRWFYNNWDFNVLGSIFTRLTGQDLFDAFADRIAAPLGMEDFSPGDCRYQHGPESLHPVYKMRLSARDLARFGQLYLNGGDWSGRRLLSEDWVGTSTSPISDLGGGRGYGYLWWTAEADAESDALSCDMPLYYASGYGGQYVVVIPGHDMVLVHRAADVDHGIDHVQMGKILSAALEAIGERGHV